MYASRRANLPRSSRHANRPPGARRPHAIGKVYRETDQAEADGEPIIGNFLSGQFYKPLRVVAFNLGEGWVSDVSEDIARELIARAHAEDADLSEATRRFVERYVDMLVAGR